MTPLLLIENLSVKFDGLVAVDGVNLAMADGEIRGLIGPNGAGKTTLFNAISGLAPLSSGRLVLAGEDITSLPAHLRAARGIRRTFQTVQLIQSFTVNENLLVGLNAKVYDRMTAFMIGHPVCHGSRTDMESEIAAVLSYLSIEDLKTREVKTLTIAQQRLVEIAQALVARPKLMMLDEPTAGLSHSQIEALDALVTKLPNDWNVSVLLVEHVVPLVMKICNRITVLDRGRVIAEGSGAEVAANRDVRAAYLGEGVDA